MLTDSLLLSTPDGPMAAYWAEPDERSGRAVIVLQEAWGVTHHIQDVCQRFARAGFAAIAPALFHRTDPPELSYADYESARVYVDQLTRRGIDDDLRATTDALLERGYAPTATGVIGFCMGGVVSFYADTTYSFGAAATFYGGGGIVAERFGLPAMVDSAAHLRGPWMGFFGDQDHSIPVVEVEALRSATSRLGAVAEIVRYPDAGHGFHCDERPAQFNAEAAADAWQRTLGFFDKYLQAS